MSGWHSTSSWIKLKTLKTFSSFKQSVTAGLLHVHLIKLKNYKKKINLKKQNNSERNFSKMDIVWVESECFLQ